MPDAASFFTPLDGLAVVSLASRPTAALAESVERLFAITLPDPGHSAETGGLERDAFASAHATRSRYLFSRVIQTSGAGVPANEFAGCPDPASGHHALAFLSTSPNRWLVLSFRQDLYARLLDPLADLASIIDLTDQFSLLRLSGSGAREVLQKGAPIDLHPRAMRAGQAASTVIARITVLIWQRDDAPTYDIACQSSYAASFRSWLAGAIDRQTTARSDPGARDIVKRSGAASDQR